VRPCPGCDGKAVDLGRKFKPPATNKKSEWEVARFLYESGFPFNPVGEPFPNTMSEAKEFVCRFDDQKLKTVSIPVWEKHPVKRDKYHIVYIKCPWTPYENPAVKLESAQ
jgi:hypothetical protein